ncbi:MAG: hypothetical protein WAO74_13875 [Polaribacter sp.]|uniref:hypothetical protein n=1 Tax=Polaribacter sp. TaxID=1920175 RepID=UPI003BB14445
METLQLTKLQEDVISVLRTEHLTSFEILKRVNNAQLILVIYNNIDELKSMGIVNSYSKNDIKYHYLTHSN